METNDFPKNGNLTPANAKKLLQIQRSLGDALPHVLMRGFHGRVKLEFGIQDGTIQNICRNIEKIEH